MDTTLESECFASVWTLLNTSYFVAPTRRKAVGASCAGQSDQTGRRHYCKVIGAIGAVDTYTGSASRFLIGFT